jgi:hypothetical protein
MNGSKKKAAGFPESKRWKRIRDQLLMTSEQMKDLAARFTEEGREHLTEGDGNLVVAAYSGHIAAVTNSMRVNMMSRDRSRTVDDIEEIHKIIELLDCL